MYLNVLCVIIKSTRSCVIPVLGLGTVHVKLKCTHWRGEVGIRMAILGGATKYPGPFISHYVGQKVNWELLRLQRTV